MRVLIISHNVISETNNMGKTLLSYFKGFPPEDNAEFYIQEKEPRNAEAAASYFRITDRDALKAIFGKKAGVSFHLDKTQAETAVHNTGIAESIRQYGRKRNAFVYFMRNAVWALAHWKTKEFSSWLKKVNPEVIFFMSGDYGFMYMITMEIQKMLDIPLVVCCVDDYYLYNRNGHTLFGRYQHQCYMKRVNALMSKASCILTISDMMRDAYSTLFSKPCFTLHTSAHKRTPHDKDNRTRIAYFGNLGFRRYEQLAEMGKAVRFLGIEGIEGIDVYSGEQNPENLKGLTEENGIFFHGEIPFSEVPERMDECLAVIHTESFDPEIQNIIKYSVSTKLADSLMNGPCIIAYGPDNIASVDYLKEHKAAYVISRQKDLVNGLREILTNRQLREEIVLNARELAEENHDESVNPLKVSTWLQMAVDGVFNRL